MIYFFTVDIFVLFKKHLYVFNPVLFYNQYTNYYFLYFDVSGMLGASDQLTLHSKKNHSLQGCHRRGMKLFKN